MEIMDRIARTGVVPVVVLDRAADAVPTANALLSGGIDVMEITFRTSAAAEAIRLVKESVPSMCVGAGSIRTPAQCRLAMELGAGFIVSAGLSREIVELCQKKNVPVLPGCVTPTEIMAALDLELRTVKFFPAGTFGGLKAVKAMSEPFPELRFVPTGGINENNLEEYLRSPFIHAVGGSWLCRREDIAAGRFETISLLCSEAVRIVQAVRGNIP